METAELVLVVSIVSALGASVRVPRFVESRRTEAFLYSPPSTVPLQQILDVWARRLDRPIFLDASVVYERLEFSVVDVPLTWELTKRILDLHDVVIDDRTAPSGPLVARLRRNLPTS